MVRLTILSLLLILFSTKAFAPIFISSDKEYDSIEEVYVEGLELFVNKQFKQSQEYFQKFLEEDPNNEFAPRVKFYYAMTYFWLNNFIAAEDQFNEFLINYGDQEVYPDFLYYFSKTLHKLSTRKKMKCDMVNSLLKNHSQDPFTLVYLEKDKYFSCEKKESKLGKLTITKNGKKKEPKKEPATFSYQEGVVVPIAIADFHSDNSLLRLTKEIPLVINDNLERSGIFNPIDKKNFIQSSSSLNNRPRFEDWKIIKAKFLVSGKITEESNQISIEFRLFNVDEQKQILSLKYETKKNNWRRVSQIISDKIYEAITKDEGMFDTRIVYVAESGSVGNRQKKLAIMDQDQANHHFFTDGSYLVATPSFSPDSQMITYMSYAKPNSPRVFIFDIETGQQEIVGEFPGMTFAPRFSPDGSKIVMSYSDPEVGNAEVYVLDLQTRVTKRITDSSGIDIAGTFSPDGEKIVFNSDRTGRRHLYIINSNGRNLERISREGGSYYDPSWSPKGDKIAFTKQEGGQFYIGVMDIDGSNERMLSKSFHVEAPRWSSNGKFLIYYKTERVSADGSGGNSSLYSIDITGYNERKIHTPLGAIQPDWSLLMH